MDIHFDFLLKACKEGDVGVFKPLFLNLSTEQKGTFLSYNHYECYHLAIFSGNLMLIDFISEAIERAFGGDFMPPGEVLEPAFDARQGEGFISSLEKRDVPVVASLLSEPYLHYKCCQIINQKLEYIQFVLQNPILQSYRQALFNYACGSDLETVKRWVSLLSKEDLIQLIIKKSDPSITGNPTYMSCFHYINEPEIIDFLWKNLSSTTRNILAKHVFPSVIVLAAKANNIAIIKKILSLLNDKQQADCIKFEDYNSFVYASDRGNLDIVKLLWNSLSSKMQIEALQASNYAAFRLAKKAGHNEVMTFLESVARASLGL